MVVFPNCKINLGLHVRRKRSDGYHDLETIFYPIQKKDVLEVIPSQDGNTTLSQEGLSIAGQKDDNLILKAYQLLKKGFPQLPNVQFILYKAIPMGAGLGGGSADGTFALKLLNDRFQLGIQEDKLGQYALQLGSDCPFFVCNKPVFAESRGEKMQPIDITLSGYYIAVINPRIHVSTGWAFSQLELKDQASSFQKITDQPIENWREILYNDFENAIFQKYPAIASLKKMLYENGALFASMSGSGSSCFGIFAGEPDLSLYPSEYFKENYLL